MKNVGYGSLRSVDSLRYDLLTDDNQTVYFVDVAKKEHQIKLDEKSQKWVLDGKKIWVFLEKKGNPPGIYIDLL